MKGGAEAEARGGRPALVAWTASQEARAGTLAAALGSAAGGDWCARTLALGDPGTAAQAAHARAAVVLLGPGDVPEGLAAFLDAAEEARVGVLLLVDGPQPGAHARRPGGGVAVEPLGTGDASVAAVLRGMDVRQREVERLGRELAVAGRFTAGLRTEISRMQDELRLAAEVQRDFLPREFPEVGSVRIAAFWRPAGYVSGDVYDVLRLDERHVGVFVADAVGHGVPAAILTMVLCRGLPTRDAGNGSYRIVPPGEALARVNAEMVRHQGRTTRFATAIYAVVDCASGRVRLASAGHPAPTLLRADGSTGSIAVSGGLLGVFDGEEYPESEAELAPGDRLAVHSDGFEQAFPGDPSGSHEARVPTRRFLQELDAVRAAPTAAALTEQVGRRIDMQFGSVRQADDVTLLVVERLRHAAG